MEIANDANGDRKRQHTNFRVGHLIEAYLNLESAANREVTAVTASKIEMALAVIQLLGTTHQVRLAQEFIAQFAKSRTGSFDQLLENLRQDIRAELDLDSQPGISLLRIGVVTETVPAIPIQQ